MSMLRADPMRGALGIAAALVMMAHSGVSTGASETAKKGDPAAVVENGIPETALATVRLTERAVERLGVRTVSVELRSMDRTQIAGGVVEAPPGGIVQVVAPQQGTVLVAGQSLPLPGTKVAAGEPLLRIRALSASEIARARDIVDSALARLRVAEAALAARGEDEGRRAERDSAAVSLEAARQRLRIMRGEAGQGDGSDGLAPLTITSPTAAIVRRLDVTPGQSVPSGAPLVELVRVDALWVRVPIYAGLLRSIRAGAPARIRTLGDSNGAGWQADIVSGPPSADPLAGTVDLFYRLARLSDGNTGLVPGERVIASLLLGDAEERLVVPQSAVLYDVNGGTWVYERIAPATFARKRVAVDDVLDGFAVLSQGPGEGAEIVTDGAVEIFGTEFGTGK